MSNSVIGEFCDVEVIEYSRSGVMVAVAGMEKPQLIHVSKISSEFVKDASKFVKIGDILKAQWIKGTTSNVELSLKHLNLSATNGGKRDDGQSKPKSLDSMITRLNKVQQEKNKDIKNRLKRFQK
jgi:predicted RNA-binding protein with RPS1 domain